MGVTIGAAWNDFEEFRAPSWDSTNVRLCVGPDAWIPDRLRDAVEGWLRFAQAIPAGPPGIACFDVYEADGIGESVAVTVPERGCRDFWIALGRRFFERPAEEEQTLTLLHECLHVRLHAGPLRERTEASLLLNQQNWPSPVGRRGDFLAERYTIACWYRNFVDGMLAEQVLKQDFGDWFVRRWTYYREMRRNSFNGRGFDRFHEDLKNFAFGYEFLRMTLGAQLAEDPNQRDDFTAMANQVWEELEARCAGTGWITDCQCLRELCQRMLELNFQTNPQYDFTAFDEAFAWVMATPEPPNIHLAV